MIRLEYVMLNHFPKQLSLITYFKILLMLFFLIQSLPLAVVAQDERKDDKMIVQRIHAHLEIKDIFSACEEARNGLILHPDSRIIHEAYIKSLSHTNDDKALWKVWKSYESQFSNPYENRDLLETMAWGIIKTGSTSSSPLIRAIALLGAFFGQDAQGVEIMCRHLHDSNSFIRSLAVKLASHMHDVRLSDEMFRLFQQEKNWTVRFEVIKALGEMKLEAAQPLLMSEIANPHSTPEEKSAAIKSLVQLLDTAQKENLNQLVASNRAGFRLLACEFIEYFDLKEEIEILGGLLKDSHAEVRAGSLHALGAMRINLSDYPVLNQQCIKLANDTNPEVAIMSAWVLVLNNNSLGQKTFEKLLKHETPEVRQLSAAALATTGKYGAPYVLTVFNQSTDPFVNMNLAIGLISQRISTEKACQVLYEGLMNVKERWMWEENGYFKVLQKSKIKHDDSIPNLPESVNQITRLDVLNILSIMKYPDTQNALKTFLQHSSNDVSGMASALLLKEGDEEAIKIVEDLLHEQNKKIKIQAALVLAMWGGGEEVVNTLEKAYADSDRGTKERILEGLGRVGESSSIKFLVAKLNEPSQTLRIIAASALLECLNH
jgi:HEAT repeat protein